MIQRAPRKPPASAFERAATAATLPLQAGKRAVKSEYRKGIESRIDYHFTASVDLDAIFHDDEPGASRWDYGLGLKNARGRELALWVEPHPASSTSEVHTMIDKLVWLKKKLARPEFSAMQALTSAAERHGSVYAFRWLAMTGDITIRAGSAEARRLSSNGLAMPVRHLALP